MLSLKNIINFFIFLIFFFQTTHTVIKFDPHLVCNREDEENDNDIEIGNISNKPNVIVGRIINKSEDNFNVIVHDDKEYSIESGKTFNESIKEFPIILNCKSPNKNATWSMNIVIDLKEQIEDSLINFVVKYENNTPRITTKTIKEVLGQARIPSEKFTVLVTIRIEDNADLYSTKKHSILCSAKIINYCTKLKVYSCLLI